MRKNKVNRIRQAMERLNVSAHALARESGIDHSLISKWVSGTRSLTRRSEQLRTACEALLRLDVEHRLDAFIAPYRSGGRGNESALYEFLLDEDVPGLPPRVCEPDVPRQGTYTKEVIVYLGQSGFRQAALSMLDYTQVLPPGREIMILCQGRYEWITGSLPFVIQFIAKLRKAIARETRLLVINRRGYSISETAAFAGPWLVAHLRGYIRSRYYDGELPEDLRFVGVIRSYLSGRAEEDALAEDNLYVSMSTDPRDISKAETLCTRYLEVSSPASQYGFLKKPEGALDNARLWTSGPLPSIAPDQVPQGNFSAICQIPGIGLMTAGEVARVLRRHRAPPIPDYLFPKRAGFAPGPHRIILCRESIRDALAEIRTVHPPLCELTKKCVSIPRKMLVAQLTRLLAEADRRPDFQVALMPRVAFSKLQLELVCWQNSVSVGWLQDMEESVFADDKATSGSFYGFIDFIWDKLLKGWKRRETVKGQIMRYITGNDVPHEHEQSDSAIARNWDMYP